MPTVPLDSASWMMPGHAAGQHPGHRPGRQRHVHDDDEHEIERRDSADDKSREARLQRERQSYRDENAGRFHS